MSPGAARNTAELEHPPLGAEQHLLRDGRAFDTPAGIAEKFASSSGSGISASDSMWLVAKPSIALATGISESALSL